MLKDDDNFDSPSDYTEFSMLEGERIYYNFLKELYLRYGTNIEEYRDELIELGKNLSLPVIKQEQIELYLLKEMKEFSQEKKEDLLEDSTEKKKTFIRSSAKAAKIALTEDNLDVMKKELDSRAEEIQKKEKEIILIKEELHK